MTAEWWLVAGMGLAGSAHCIGMCGGFAVLAHGAGPRGLGRTFTWLGGKAVTYAALGAVAGLAGYAVRSATGTQTVLTIAVGLLLIALGLASAGVIPDRMPGIGAVGPVFSRAMARIVGRPGASGPFLLGLLNGLLPCGLVYAALAAAAGTGTLVGGTTTMLVFGAATAPSLAATAWAAGRLGPVVMRRVARAGGWLVVLLGLMTLWRAWMTAMNAGGHATH